MPTPRRLPPFRLAALTGALLFASLLSCGREITGPDGRGGRSGALFLDPQYPTLRLAGTGEVLNIGSVVDFDRVRVVLRRSDGSVAVDTLVPFPANVESVSLKLNLTLDPQAPASGETLSATMKYVNPTGDTVFSGGPVAVTARPTTSGTPPAAAPIELSYVGAGANAKSITISPTELTGLRLDATTFAATVLDSSDAPLPLAPVAFTSTDAQRVSVDLRTGAASLVGARGDAKIIAQTLTGQSDTAYVTITPIATNVVVVGGGNQQTAQGSPFPNPVRVRAIAVDNIGVEGVIIAFDVIQGQGTVSQVRDTTDANGEATVVWTAGDSAGTSILRASIYDTPIGINIGGTQLSTAANNLTFSSQPPNITAGSAIPAFAVVVRNVSGDTVKSYNSGVSLALAGGTDGATLIGTTTVTALNGVAVFTGLTIDRGGTGYRLVASLPALPGVPPAQTGTFNAAPAPPAVVQLLSGGGQSGIAGTALPDSIKFRVRDAFNFPVAGVTVDFAVTAGGGTVSPASATTDASGLAAARWTIGTTGAQQMTATVSGLTPAVANATVAGGGGGPPALYLGYDEVSIGIGHVRQVPVFLSNPTPTPLTVTLTMRDPVATWSSGSVVIPGGGTQAFPTITGLLQGATYAVASSSAGTDSVWVLVDSATAKIDGYGSHAVIVGDTLRTMVYIPEPAGVGGVTITVVSNDSSAVLVAPGAGGGYYDVCPDCAGLRAEPGPMGALLAPPSGTAVITIPEGQLGAQLVVVPIAPNGNSSLTLEAPGLVGVGTVIYTIAGEPTFYSYYTNVGVGQRSEVEVYRLYETRRTTLIRYRSLAPTVVSIDSIGVIPRGEYYSNQVYWTGLAEGSAQLVAEIDGAADTVTVNVRPAQLRAIPTVAGSVPLGTRVTVDTYLGYDNFGFFSYGTEAGIAVPITITSRNPAVVRPDFGTARVTSGQYYARTSLEAVGSGTTWVVFSAPGHIADSALFNVVGSALGLSTGTTRVGVGMINSSFNVFRLPVAARADAVPVTLTSSDPSILRILTPNVTISATASSATVRLMGVSAGTATVVATAPGHDPDSIPVQVFPGVLVLNTHVSPTTLDPDSAARGISATMTDGQFAWSVADTVIAKIRSTDPAILLVTDSILRFLPGFGSGGTGGTWRAIAPGTAQLIIDVPGLVPDTSALITVRPPRLLFSGTVVTTGRGLRANATLQRLTATTAAQPVNYTISGTGGSTLVLASDVIPVGTTTRTVAILGGNTLGTDTLIATAAGMTADTILVSVVGTRVSIFGHSSQMELGSTQDFIDVRFRNDSSSTAQAVNDTMYVRVTSRDPSVVLVSPETFRILPGVISSQPYGQFLANGPGQTYIVTEHLNGVAAADSVLVQVRTPRLFVSDYGTVVMGMQEKSYDFTYYVEREQALETPLWVRLTSSAPEIVSVPDSVLIPAFSYYTNFNLTSSDTTGSAFITASADGYASSGFPAFVTTSEFRVYVSGSLAPDSRTWLEVYRLSGNYSSHPSLVPIPIRMSVADTTIAKMVPDTATFPVTSSYYHDFEWLETRAPGSTYITVEDRRDGEFVRTLPGSAPIGVLPRRLDLNGVTTLFTTPGTSTSTIHAAYSNGNVDSAWVRFTSVGGKFAPLADSTLLRNTYSVTYGVRGIAEGIDTLVIEFPGHSPESLTVRITKGILVASNYIPTIRQGDSVAVTLTLRSANDQTLFAQPGPVTLTLGTAGDVQTTLGAGPISTATIGTGGSSVTFYVKALAPGGGTVTITHPAINPLELTFATRSP